jgi:predicted nucleic acid-binding protein
LTFCLDAWAVLRWLDGEDPAASRVELAIESQAVMSWINLGEVFYTLLRRGQGVHAGQVVGDLRSRLVADRPTGSLVLQAATIKAWNRVSYADAFAVATAVAHDAVLLTGDPEILCVDELCRIEDLR